MSSNKFDHVGFTDIGIHLPYLLDDYRLPKILRGHFMSKKLDYFTTYNNNDSLLGVYQHRETISITIIGRRTESCRNRSGLVGWLRQQFIVHGHIIQTGSPKGSKKSIKYSLVAKTITAKKFKNLESPALYSALQASILLTKNHRGIVARQASLLGFNNDSLYSNQGRKHIHVLMNFGKSDCITKQHLMESIEGHKLEIVFSGTLFSNNFLPLTKYTKNSWITSTWHFL